MLRSGTHVGRYEIQRRLGRGGMGTVYLAQDPALNRLVAIKMFLGDLEVPDAAERFAREARSSAALNHANIVTVYDFGDFESQPYIVMEYVPGETMAQIIRRKAPLTASEKLRWIEELCTGVAYAHRAGVIHRDIKPTNLMIDQSGRLKILDFGIARMLGTLASNATALIGTPGYMAPEQIRGGVIDHRSDLFSIGVVCYELLSYTEAFPGDTVPTITHRVLSEEPVALERLVPDVSPELAAVVERALKKNAADRFTDGEAFRAAVGRVRRDLEREMGWDDSPPMARGEYTPPAGDSSRGTGSARKGVHDAVGVAQLTPPPDPRRPDREAIARRRTSQIEAALEQATAFLELEDFDAALEACYQALTLDDAHGRALEVERAIKTSAARRRAAALLEQAGEQLARGALAAAQDLLQQSRALNPDAPEARRLERDLRLARVEQERLRQRAAALRRALDAGAQALQRGDVETALAQSREALELDPWSEEARELGVEAMRRLDEETTAPAPDDDPDRTYLLTPAGAASDGVTIAPASERRAAVVADPPPSGTSPPASSAVCAGARPAYPRWTIVAAGTAAVGLVGAVIAALTLVPPEGVPAGALVIEATPWATITAVEAEDGTRIPLPAPASTPMWLSVPPGSYRIHLAGPDGGADTRVITADVQSGATTTAPAAQFEPLTPEEYFERYLPGAVQ